MLVYLYTLKVPALGTDWKNADYAHCLGDKYNLPHLKDAGRFWFLQRFRVSLGTWYKSSESVQTCWIMIIKKVWSYQTDDSPELRSAILDNLMPNSKPILENEKFQTFMMRNKDFLWAFMRALAEKVSLKW